VTLVVNNQFRMHSNTFIGVGIGDQSGHGLERGNSRFDGGGGAVAFRCELWPGIISFMLKKSFKEPS
jgi:hypothetical protein